MTLLWRSPANRYIVVTVALVALVALGIAYFGLVVRARRPDPAPVSARDTLTVAPAIRAPAASSIAVERAVPRSMNSPPAAMPREAITRPVPAKVSSPRGDCVAQDKSVVRKSVTQNQCAEICPTCSWESTARKRDSMFQE